VKSSPNESAIWKVQNWARFNHRRFQGMVGVVASGMLPNTADASHSDVRLETGIS